MMPPDRKIVADSSAAAAASAGFDQIQSHEDKRDHGGGEDFKETFDPQVNDPPPPILDHRQVRMLAPRQTGSVEQRDRSGGDGQQHHQVPLMTCPEAQDCPAVELASKL